MKYKFEEEVMNEEFTKYHLKNFPFNAVLHKFSPLDLPGQIHDHPWGFTSFIIKGGYVERIYHVAEDGTWTSEDVEHLPGSSHYVAARGIHEILSYPNGECWTLILPGEPEHTSRVWDFSSKIATSRAWNE